MSRSKKKLTSYFARLFTDKQEAEEYITRIQRKLGSDFDYEIVWHPEYERWHAKHWKESEV